MNWLIVGRDHLQAATLVFTLASIVMMAVMLRHRVLPWRVTVMPGLILVQLATFYLYVLIVQPPPSEGVTTWSAALRLETVAAFFMSLAIYWGKRGR